MPTRSAIHALVLLGACGNADAEVVVTTEQVGNGIFMSGGGTANLDGLFLLGTLGMNAGMSPAFATISFGRMPDSFLSIDAYANLTQGMAALKTSPAPVRSASG